MGVDSGCQLVPDASRMSISASPMFIPACPSCCALAVATAPRGSRTPVRMERAHMAAPIFHGPAPLSSIGRGNRMKGDRKVRREPGYVAMLQAFLLLPAAVAILAIVVAHMLAN